MERNDIYDPDDNSRTRAERRKKDFAKAKRKQAIIKHYGLDWYDNLHQYSKNKIHCSCALCACKTRGLGRDDWPLVDLRRITEMRDQMEDY